MVRVLLPTFFVYVKFDHVTDIFVPQFLVSRKRDGIFYRTVAMLINWMYVKCCKWRHMFSGEFANSCFFFFPHLKKVARICVPLALNDVWNQQIHQKIITTVHGWEWETVGKRWKLSYSSLVGKRVFTLDIYKNIKDGRNEEWSQMIYTVIWDLCTILGQWKKQSYPRSNILHSDWLTLKYLNWI